MDHDTVAVYERRAHEWIERRGGATDGLGGRFRDLVGQGVVADLGCGAGRYLAELGDPVVGMDATASMLELARRVGRPLVRGDLERLPFADAVLSGVFARHSYLHVRKDRVPGALREARRVLRPGGVFLATLIEGTYEGHELPGDDFAGRFFACWSEAEIAAALSAAGLVDVSVERVIFGPGPNDLVVTARR